MMSSVNYHSNILQLLLAALLSLSFLSDKTTCAFQFMKNLKMPTNGIDANEDLLQERFGGKKLVVITGTSSGLGRQTVQALLQTEEYHVIGAVRDLDKMEAVAELDGFNMDRFDAMECDLNSFESVRNFCEKVDEYRLSKPVDRLICNAGVYQPSLGYAKWSKDGHEQTMQTNFLSHFLMISLLLDGMMDGTDPRVTMVGSVTGNDNTVGGGGVYPIADLHELEGLKLGFENPIAMADGYGFVGAKAYKDSKLCLMVLANYLHTKYYKLSGVSFSSMYPGCIAESPLFREKREWFRKYFPVFMKYITGGYVGEQEAGQRLMQVAHDPRCSRSGVYWSWNGGPREGRGAVALEQGGQISGGGGAGGGWDSIYENEQSGKVLDIDTATKLFTYATQITGADWPKIKQVRSPCPTLNVIGAVTKGMVAREENKRMLELGRPGLTEDGLRQDVTTPVSTIHESMPVGSDEVNEILLKPVSTVSTKTIQISKRAKAILVAQTAVGTVFKYTVKPVVGFTLRRLLGRMPDNAVKGSYETAMAGLTSETTEAATDTVSSVSTEEEQFDSATHEDKEFIEAVISEQIAMDNKMATRIDEGDESLFEELYGKLEKKDLETRDKIEQ